MGYIKHHSIVVQGSEERVISLWRKAQNLGLLVSGVIMTPVNGGASFFVAPDGSKEGWNTSNEYNQKRNEFIEQIKSGESVDWVLVEFGGDYNDARVIDHHDNDED